MQEFFTNAFYGFGITDAIDIVLVAIVIYFTLKMIMETRAQQILKGILLLIIVTILSGTFNLYVLNWICKGAVALGAVAILIVFQPELRRALEFLGRSRIVNGNLGKGDKEEDKKVVAEIVKAISEFSSTKTGALIVFERNTSLSDVCETGTIVNADVSEQLLGNIFYEGAPLHDGAVVISGGYIYAAACVLPLSKNQDINKNLGTRHRAGLGITENSDALALIVSEETGIISMAEDGQLQRFMDVKSVEKRLLDMYLKEDNFGDAIGKLTGIHAFVNYMKSDTQNEARVEKMILKESHSNSNKKDKEDSDVK